MRVLVTDADYKNALAAVRSLGTRGIHVVAGSTSRLAQSFFSKYCRERVVYPSPQDEDAHVAFMLDYLKKNPVDVLLPIGYTSSLIASRHLRELSERTRVPVAMWDQMQIACDKYRSVEFARRLGVPVPESYTSIAEVRSFPVVVKDYYGQGTVRYPKNPSELAGAIGPTTLIQEYIPGEGYGLYALFRRGEPRAIFMHRRIREFPPDGGASTAAESVDDPRLKELGLRLLTGLRWHGVAMAEFKRDRRDGEFKLMEINPKFWGSLDLSIASGVDFPYLTATMAQDGDVAPVYDYAVGVRYHWPIPDEVLHVAARPSSLGSLVRDSLDQDVKSNLWRTDLRPTLIQAGLIVPRFIAFAGSRNLRSPPGRFPVVP